MTSVYLIKLIMIVRLFALDLFGQFNLSGCERVMLCTCTCEFLFDVSHPDCICFRFWSADQLHTSVLAGMVYRSCTYLLQSYTGGMRNFNRRLSMLLEFLYGKRRVSGRQGLETSVLLVQSCLQFSVFLSVPLLLSFLC